VAALIAEATGVTPDVVAGGRGEFTVWVDGALVAEKSRRGFPSDDAVLEAVRKGLSAGELG
jgi:hypothetical protein